MAEPNGEEVGTWSGVWTIGPDAEEIPGVLKYAPLEGFELLLPGVHFGKCTNTKVSVNPNSRQELR